MKASENENSGRETNGQPHDSERVGKSMCQNQVKENKIDEKITRAVTSAVMTVENRMNDAHLTAIDNVVIPRAEMTVKLITGSTSHGTNSEVQNPDKRDVFGKFRNTPLMSASSGLDLHNELDRNDESRNDVGFNDGDFTALKYNYDRREHTHHTRTYYLVTVL